MINQVMDEFEQAKQRMAAASKPVLDGARQSAGVAGGYVRGHPWAALGIAIAAGLLLGFLSAKR